MARRARSTAIAAVAAAPVAVRPAQRHVYADNLKVLLVCGVIVAHVTMAWTGLETWVFDEPTLRQPLLSLLTAAELVGGMFGMSLFFLIAGMFTPRSLARKGLGRFLVERTMRLGIPMVFFMLVLSPVVEYVDPQNDYRERGFLRSTPEIWVAIVPGPTWFLGVLLLFSVLYGVVRSLVPATVSAPGLMPGRYLVVVTALVAISSYVLRLAVPLGEERWHIGVAQAPAWVAAFVLGVVGGERGWFDVLGPRLSRRLCRSAWGAVTATVLVVGVVGAAGGDLEEFAGGGTALSLVAASLEAVIALAMSLWLLDVFRRRVDHQGGPVREMSRAAFAAFIVHQVVLVGLVLASHHTGWPREVEYLSVCVLGVAGSFGIGSALVRLPGVRRVV